MVRHAIRWSAGASVALAFAVAGLTALSWRAGQTFHLDRATGSPADMVVQFRHVRVARGGVLLRASTSRYLNAEIDWAWSPPPLNSGWRVARVADPRTAVRVAYPVPWTMPTHWGFAWRVQRRPTWSSADVVVPAAVPIACLAAPAVVLGVRHARRTRRPTAGAWAACGYDLHATPDRCPECGAVASRY